MRKRIVERLQNNRATIFTALASLIGILVSIAGALSVVQTWVPAHADIALWLLLAAGVVASAGILLYFYLIMEKNIWNPKLSSTYRIERATEADLEAIVRFGRQHLDPELSDTAPLRIYLAANPDCIFVARKFQTYRNGSLRAKLVGYYILVPVTKSTFVAWCAGVVNGIAIKREHIVPPNKSPYAVCVLVVVSANSHIGGILIRDIGQRIATKYLRKLQLVFCRPISRDGKRLMKSFDFRELPESLGRQLGPLYGIRIQDLSPEQRSRLLSSTPA